MNGIKVQFNKQKYSELDLEQKKILLAQVDTIKEKIKKDIPIILFCSHDTGVSHICTTPTFLEFLKNILNTEIAIKKVLTDIEIKE